MVSICAYLSPHDKAEACCFLWVVWFAIDQILPYILLWS